jgi:pyruvate ferredoxin oxidoreductase gamma subunit
MLGAFMKVSGMFELDYFKEKMKGVLKKLPPNLLKQI